VLAFRKTQLRRRAKVLATAEVSRLGIAARRVAIPPRAIRALGPPITAGLLLAEGDSWFDYPFHDVLRLLEDAHGFEVESVAHKGDRVEDMAFSKGQLEEFTRRLEKVLRNGKVPKAILLSGGGNDIAGTQFGVLLNHASSPAAGLNDEVVNGIINQRIRLAYTTIIASITEICEAYLQRSIPIITHGYDYAVPDGRGFLGGFWVLPGPWLQPGFREKGFADLTENKKIMRDLMDRFNKMLKDALSAFAHVRVLDLRGTLPADTSYRTYWANELHPTARGFGIVADRFARTVAEL
jgi:lysophospholipase L1-like esterase